MKIYPKKLRSISDMEREKEVLKYAEKQVSLEDLFSFNGITGKSAPSKKDTTDHGGGALGKNLGIAKIILDLALKYAMPRNLRKAEQKAEEKKSPRKNIVKSAAVEFIGGYLKWKAIELSLKGISRLIKSRKKNN